MKNLLYRVGGRALSFRDLSVGETAVPPIGREMQRGQDSPAHKSLKRLRLRRRSLGTDGKPQTSD